MMLFDIIRHKKSRCRFRYVVPKTAAEDVAKQTLFLLRLFYDFKQFNLENQG